MKKSVGIGIGIGIIAVVAFVIAFTNIDDLTSTGVEDVISQIEVNNPVSLLQTYDVDSKCELAYMIQDNLENNRGSPFKFDKDYIESIPQKYSDKAQKIVEDRGAIWAQSEEGMKASMDLMEEVQNEMVDHAMKYNSISPKLRESVEFVLSNKIYDAETHQEQIKILNTMYLIDTKTYENDPQCGKQFHESFGDKTFQALKGLYGEEGAQKKFDEIKNILY